MNTTIEKRRFTRISFDAAVEVEQHGQTWNTSVADISLKGILLIDDELTFDKKQPLTIRVLLGNELQIVMLAEWNHSENNLSGFHWTQVDIESMIHLRRLLELNNGDSELLERELNQLCHLDS